MPSGFFLGGAARGARENRKLDILQGQLNSEKQRDRIAMINDTTNKIVKAATDFTESSVKQGKTIDEIKPTLTSFYNSAKQTLDMAKMDSTSLDATFTGLMAAPSNQQLRDQKSEDVLQETISRERGQKIVRGPELTADTVYSPSLNKQFSGYQSGNGLWLMQDERGLLVQAPSDTYKASTQVTGGPEILTASQKGQETLELGRTQSGIENVLRSLNDLEKAPGATGIAGFASEKIGGLLGQIPSIGTDMEADFTKMVSGATPQEVQTIRTRAMSIAASMLSSFTGEEGKFTQEERDMANQALQTLKPGASFSQIRAATEVALELSLNNEDRQRSALGKKPRFDLSTPQGRKALGDFLISAGFNRDRAIEFVVERTKIKSLMMEETPDE